jgi:hypothetical protein
MSSMNDPEFLAQSQAFIADMQRKYLAIVCAPVGPTLKARRVFRIVTETRREWLYARLEWRQCTLYFPLSEGKIEHVGSSRLLLFFNPEPLESQQSDLGALRRCGCVRPECRGWAFCLGAGTAQASLHPFGRCTRDGSVITASEPSMTGNGRTRPKPRPRGG